MYCRKCNCKLEEDARFCPNCGTPVTVEETYVDKSREVLENTTYKNKEGTVQWNEKEIHSSQALFAGNVILDSAEPLHDGFQKTNWICVAVLAVGLIYGVITDHEDLGGVAIFGAFAMAVMLLVHGIYIIFHSNILGVVQFYLPYKIRKEQFAEYLERVCAEQGMKVDREHLCVTYRGLDFVFVLNGDTFSIRWNPRGQVFLHGGYARALYFRRAISSISYLAFIVQQATMQGIGRCRQYLAPQNAQYRKVKISVATWIKRISYSAVLILFLSQIIPEVAEEIRNQTEVEHTGGAETDKKTEKKTEEKTEKKQSKKKNGVIAIEQIPNFDKSVWDIYQYCTENGIDMEQVSDSNSKMEYISNDGSLDVRLDTEGVSITLAHSEKYKFSLYGLTADMSMEEAAAYLDTHGQQDVTFSNDVAVRRYILDGKYALMIGAASEETSELDFQAYLTEDNCGTAGAAVDTTAEQETVIAPLGNDSDEIPDEIDIDSVLYNRDLKSFCQDVANRYGVTFYYVTEDDMWETADRQLVVADMEDVTGYSYGIGIGLADVYDENTIPVSVYGAKSGMCLGEFASNLALAGIGEDYYDTESGAMIYSGLGIEVYAYADNDENSIVDSYVVYVQ